METIAPLPSWVDREAFADYIAMRKRIKKPMTDRRLRQFMCRLQELHDAGHDVNQSLDEAADHQWLDLYEPKDKSITRKVGAVTSGAQEWLKAQAEHAAKATPIPDHLRRPRRVA